MLRIKRADEPSDFDKRVRQPGLSWLARRGLASASTPPRGFSWKNGAKWTAVGRDMMTLYSSVCAYSSTRIQETDGAKSIDHFNAKSTHPAAMAYEWDNYRLALLSMNRRKGNYDDVLDPFKIRRGTYVLNVWTGEVSVNPRLSTQLQQAAQLSLKRLRLDDKAWTARRRKAWERYTRSPTPEGQRILHEDFPFVWDEARRHKLIP